MEPSVVRALRLVVSAALVFALVGGAVVACGGGSGSSGPGDAGAPQCAAGEIRKDDGTCLAPGVAPEMCGAGFRPDGNMGCDAILPADPCPKGQMAVPGETACRDVAPCAAGDYGDVPVGSDTQFVNAAYTGGASDGTSAKPWTTIGAAIAAAAPRAIVAVAAGTYVEDVTIQFKPVRLWGRCPKLVEIVGTDAALWAVLVLSGAGGTEIRDLAVRGAAGGIASSGSQGVIVDRVWVHDTANRGLSVQNLLGVTSFTMSRSLVEGAHEVSAFVLGANATFEANLVRDTQPGAADQKGGRGIAVQDGNDGTRANATVRGCVVERNRDVGISVEASDATIEATVVRDTGARASDKSGGRGITIQDHSATRARANATVRASAVLRNRDVGVFIAGSDATIEATVVQGTQPRASDQQFGRGIGIQADLTTATRAVATVSACLVDGNYEVGVLVLGADATIERTAVQGTQAQASDGDYGDGIAAIADSSGTSLEITDSRVASSARAGISSFGVGVKIGTTRVDCNAIAIDGEDSLGQPAAFELGAGDVCGCAGQTAPCQVLSSGLTPPKPIN